MNFYKQLLARIHKFCRLYSISHFNVSKEIVVAFSLRIWYTKIKGM